jgi:2-methylisocitrate lyase-like PEP mutase family enzyme
MPTQAEKALVFRALHQREGAFVMPNPWDAGTAALLVHLGFEALATTSAGYAFSEGLPDKAIGREKMMMHVAEISSATELPVSGDLENGFGDSPETVAQTILLAAAAGLVGGSIEDSPSEPDAPIYEFAHAVDRVRAAAETAHGLPFPFTLTARAENFLCGRPDLRNTIHRLQAFQEAGADVLYAPGLSRTEDIAALVKSLDRPVNVLMGLGQLSVADLSALGVRRVSVGSGLCRAALGAFLNCARELRERGTFTLPKDAVTFAEINGVFARGLPTKA